MSRRARTWLAAVLLGAALGLAATPAWGAGANRYEQEAIAADALEAFRRVITLWQEELYFELYDYGWATSRERVSMEAFAQRMVELVWVPQGELDGKFLRTDYRFRSLVYVHARIRFAHKYNPERTFTRDFDTLLLHEDGRWRIDLVQVLRSPYS